MYFHARVTIARRRQPLPIAGQRAQPENAGESRPDLRVLIGLAADASPHLMCEKAIIAFPPP
jgi:hypothetical protein